MIIWLAKLVLFILLGWAALFTAALILITAGCVIYDLVTMGTLRIWTFRGGS